MSYTKNGFPLEQASKIGHLKIINHPLITQIIQQFEETDLPSIYQKQGITGNIDFSKKTTLERIITIDGGQATIPNEYRPEKQLSFIQVAACMLKISDLEYLRTHPMVDPRDLKKFVPEPWYNPMVLPHSGIRLPWRSIKETMRALIDACLSQTGLYETLKYLVYREWEEEWNIPEEERPHMNCWSCGKSFFLKRHSMTMKCPHCNHEHRLSDYLQIGADSPDDWTKEEAASSLRNVLETLTLFHFLRVFQGKPALSSTLFIKDGPLLLRAQLSRLVEPIRSFFSYLQNSGNPFYVIGIEKNGELADFAQEYKNNLENPGDYFLPSIKFLVEEISGNTLTNNYRNRVSYGAKVILKAGQDHVLALNVPIAEFPKDNFDKHPMSSELIGFEESARTLSQLLSYQYPNALLPIVLANSAVSIARKPSGEILNQFASKIMGLESK